MDQGLGLLTNQLYRPTTKSIAPTLRFGFAVDGGWRTFESAASDLRRITKKCHSRQTSASIKGPAADVGNALCDNDARQAGAPNEGIPPDTSNAIRNHDNLQV